MVFQRIYQINYICTSQRKSCWPNLASSRRSEYLYRFWLATTSSSQNPMFRSRWFIRWLNRFRNISTCLRCTFVSLAKFPPWKWNSFVWNQPHLPETDKKNCKLDTQRQKTIQRKFCFIRGREFLDQKLCRISNYVNKKEEITSKKTPRKWRQLGSWLSAMSCTIMN